MAKKHENYWELVWALARTDFKLRYHGSVLGYVWALLKPLLHFFILNFVFSTIFNPRNSGIQHFSLQLLTSIMLFNFFSEGTMAGLNSLLGKASLVTKIYVPALDDCDRFDDQRDLIFAMNLIIIAVFFTWYGFWPGIPAILMFVFFILLTFILDFVFFLYCRAALCEISRSFPNLGSGDSGSFLRLADRLSFADHSGEISSDSSGQSDRLHNPLHKNGSHGKPLRAFLAKRNFHGYNRCFFFREPFHFPQTGTKSGGEYIG